MALLSSRWPRSLGLGGSSVQVYRAVFMAWPLDGQRFRADAIRLLDGRHRRTAVQMAAPAVPSHWRTRPVPDAVSRQLPSTRERGGDVPGNARRVPPRKPAVRGEPDPT